VLLALALGAAGASAQLRPPGSEPDLNDLALAWARGRYGAPVVCEIDGSPRRVLRSLLIAPGPPDSYPPVDRIRFTEVENSHVTRCFGEAGGDQPNLAGELDITLPGRSRPDTAGHDFEQELRQHGGFVFQVRSGRLRVSPWSGGGDPRDVDFAGGEATFRAVERGSDAARVLQEFEGRPLRVLELKARDGTVFRFPMVLVAPR
jgi:hypothetical protein